MDFAVTLQRQVAIAFQPTTSALLLNPAYLPLRGTSAVPSSLAVTGGEYKAQEHIHRDIADSRLLAIPAS